MIQLNGGTRGYVPMFRAYLAKRHTEKEIPSIEWLWKVVNRSVKQGRTKPVSTPYWLVVELTRYVERNERLDYFDAAEAALRWFDVVDGEGEEQESNGGGE